MQRGGWLVCLGLVLLALLGGGALIEGPETAERAEDAHPAAPAQAAMLTAPQPQPVERDAPAGRTMSARRFALSESAAACVSPVRVVADGNGNPIASRAYVRTVYAACPLEDMPG